MGESGAAPAWSFCTLVTGRGSGKRAPTHGNDSSRHSEAGLSASQVSGTQLLRHAQAGRSPAWSWRPPSLRSVRRGLSESPESAQETAHAAPHAAEATRIVAEAARLCRRILGTLFAGATVASWLHSGMRCLANPLASLWDSASTRKTRLAERRRTMAAAYARYAAHCAPFLTAFGALEAFAVKPQSCLPTIGHRHHRDRVSAAALRASARRRPPRMLCC